ncbi:MAG: T9SS type A sorting domain-containing protein [Ferruginibacter sp.]
MKQIILFVFTAFFITGIYAQPFSSYINSTSTWSMYTGAADGVNFYMSHFRYEINADTTIAGKNYFKLYRVGVDSIVHFMYSAPPDVSFDSSYIGALREDPSKKLYFIFKNESVERFLYDFGLLPGMTLQNMHSNYGCNSPALVVQSYDIVYLGNVALKRFRLDNLLIEPIIEGVGSVGGLIEQGSMCLAYHNNTTLICYKKDNAILEVNTANFPCNQKIDSILVPVVDNPCNEFLIYPNPAIDKIYIRAACADQIRAVRLINPLGQKIMILTGLQQNYLALNVSMLPKGVFFVCIETNKGLITKKVVKG